MNVESFGDLVGGVVSLALVIGFFVVIGFVVVRGNRALTKSSTRRELDRRDREIEAALLAGYGDQQRAQEIADRLRAEGQLP